MVAAAVIGVMALVAGWSNQPSQGSEKKRARIAVVA
jgi:hypothetical protein